MNPKLGDVGFKAGGKNYVLNMGVNALCIVEDQARMSSSDLLGRVLREMRVSDIRLLFWAGLQRHQPDVDIDAAGDLMQAMGKAKASRKPLDLVLDSVRLCSPALEESVEGAGDDAAEGPQPATEGGTGTPSS